MTRIKGMPFRISGSAIVCVPLAAGFFVLAITGGKPVRADEPPDPPPEYTLTVTKQGGDFTCEVRLDQPETTDWSSDPIEKTYDPLTEYAPAQRVNCPVFFTFDRWESDEDGDLHGWDETSNPDFELTEDTTATAVFEPFCPGQVVIDMYNNPNVLGYGDELQYSPAPGCESLTTDQVCYEDLLFENPGNFSYSELDCNHAQSLPDEHPHWQWDDGLSDMFQGVRDAYDSAIPVSSAYRCPRHNTYSESKSTSKHAYGRAFDWFGLSDTEMWKVAEAAETSGVSDDRIFLYGGGSYQSFSDLKASGYSGTNLPPGWTSYTNGHADRG